MKKLLVFVLFLIPICFVSAATNPKVVSLTATADNNTIKFNGTMEDGSHAVMCKLYNTSDEELDLLSTAVAESKFEGTFTVSEKGDYKVACANYEGGDITIASTNVEKVVYKITFDPNGGTVKNLDVPATMDAGTEFELPKLDTKQVEPPKGYKFDAYEINGERYEAGKKYTVNSDTTIKVLWVKKKNSGNSGTFDAGIKGSLILLAISGTGIAAYFATKKKTKKASK